MRPFPDRTRMISVIIPTFNEGQSLPATLDALAANHTPHEVIVVDAGSDDGTGDLAEARGAKVLPGVRRHRALQMNVGAMQAHGGVYLFLHADTHVAPTALERIRSAVDGGRVGGAFARRYDSPSLFLRTTCFLADIRGQLSGWFLGDQALFVRWEVFEILNGFYDLDVFEDLDFARRMRCEGPTAILRPPVISSARRFDTCGPLRTTLGDFFLTALYAMGRDPNLLSARRGDSCQPSERPSSVAAALFEQSTPRHQQT